MLVFLNKYSNNGRGYRRWEKLKARFEDEYAGHNYEVISEITDLGQRLDEKFNKGERIFVAAGGDGTVNRLLNVIMQMGEDKRNQLTLGAIGLGSSNDFHKPFLSGRAFSGKAPFKLDWRNAVSHNVGQVDFDDESGNRQRRYFIINCSIGIIASANLLFNSKDKMVNWLKAKWVAATIWYAALRILINLPNINTGLRFDDKSFTTEATNLSIFINRHFSGSFRYDFEISPKSERFGIALCEKMRLPDRLKTIFALANGKFKGLPKTSIYQSTGIEIFPEEPTPIELDGEVYMAHNIKINLHQGGLKVCT